MSMDLDSILGEFATAEGSPTVAFDVLKRIGRALGYDHAIAAFSPKAGDRNRTFVASTYSQQWMQEENRMTLAEVLKDPVVNHLNSRVEPIFWSKKNYDQVGLSSFYERFYEQGLGSGIALAVRGLHGEMLSVGLANAEQVEIGGSAPVTQMGALYLSATAMFNRVAADLEKKKKKQLIPEDAPKLTPREIECLQWARVGKTSWEVAKILGISQATSIFHMKNAISKLDASNKTHAVMVAVERGLIG
jgi:LuxR family transcriptional regulator, quorum-sensing system regulator LasR